MASEFKNRYRPYDKAYNKKPEIKKAKANRQRARRLMIKEYGKAALKGKDVDHKDGDPVGKNANRRSNLQIMSAHDNRAKH